jgi:hypothetical protein
MQWAVAIVLTPGGWVGRIDTFGPKGSTIHCEVLPKVESRFVDQLAAILEKKGAQVGAGAGQISFLDGDEEDFEDLYEEDDLIDSGQAAWRNGRFI